MNRLITRLPKRKRPTEVGRLTGLRQRGMYKETTCHAQVCPVTACSLANE